MLGSGRRMWKLRPWEVQPQRLKLSSSEGIWVLDSAHMWPILQHETDTNSCFDVYIWATL